MFSTTMNLTFVDSRFFLQALKKPVPPSLTVQCELQQDYAYGDGPDAKIDETRSVPVYMVHVQALNADQTPRPGEQFQIYAVDHAKVSYPFRPSSLVWHVFCLRPSKVAQTLEFSQHQKIRCLL